MIGHVPVFKQPLKNYTVLNYFLIIIFITIITIKYY